MNPRNGKRNNGVVECWTNVGQYSLTPRPARAFTLIEMIGVLAIIAILAAMLVPATIREMDAAARTKEWSDLSAISNALILHIVQNKSIPSTNTWKDAVAGWLRQPVPQITTTSRGKARAFVMDGGGWLGSTALPWSQSSNGIATLPARPRVMILSTIANALPVGTSQLTANAFDEIWNTPDRSKPSSWTNWVGKGEDLLIQRVNLDPLFHRLVLVNRDTIGSAPRFSIDTTNTTALQATNLAGQNAFYLDGTVVGLCDPGGTPMVRLQLTNDFGFVFEGNIWLDQISGNESSEMLASEFADLAEKFLKAQWYPGANQPGRGDQQGALIAMFNFMLVFSMWADQFPHFPKHGATATQVPEYQLLNDLINGSALGSPGGNGLIDLFTGANGLLN